MVLRRVGGHPDTGARRQDQGADHGRSGKCGDGVCCPELVIAATSRAERAVGALLGVACGDALGVPYEFAPIIGAEETPEMKGGGLGDFDPGEWSDDTAMTVAVAEGLLVDGSLDDRLDAIARRFLDWYEDGPADIGVQTRAVLGRTAEGLSESTVRPALAMRAEAEAYAASHTRAAGNGALMRTAPIALAYQRDRNECARVARAVAELTHCDPLVGDSCVLWTEAIRVAVAGEGMELMWGLDLLPDDRQSDWRRRLEDALSSPPSSFTPNGFTRTALQAAWASVKRSRMDAELSLSTAVRIGDDTDTVAAIAGSLLGAYIGEAKLPSRWLMAVHGWPGYRAHDLADLALRLAGIDQTSSSPLAVADPRTVQHPLDDGVFFGNVVGDQCTAVLDLAGSAPQISTFGERLVVKSWYFPDREPLDQAPWLAHAAETIRDLRSEGHIVHVHFPCEHVWPVAVAMAYATLLGSSVHDAWEAVCGPWPWAGSWNVIFFAVRDLAADYWSVPLNDAES